MLLAEGNAVRELFSTADGARLHRLVPDRRDHPRDRQGRFASAPTNVDLVAISRDGNSRKASLLESTSTHGSLTMSADGRTVAYTQNRDERDDIWTLSLATVRNPKR